MLNLKAFLSTSYFLKTRFNRVFNMTTFTPGMRIECRNAEWLINRVEVANSSSDQIIYCVGTDDLTRGHEAAFLTQLEKIKPVDPRKTKLVRDDSNSYSKAKLFLEAQLRQMPLTDPDPHVDGIGAFKPMNYQKEAVQRAISQLRPRLLLADAVGLGKTIEVGMILSELIRRGQGKRILVLAKKSMLAQFQSELWNRFAIPLTRLDSVGLAKLQLKIPASKNPFEVYHRIIMSIDTLKDIGRYSHFLEDTRWDAVVIDEAHNVSGGSNPEKHLSYRLARRLSRRTNSMILTTATPHNGKRETFGRLISLLDPSAIPDPKLKEYEASDIKPFFMMRFKEDVKAEAGDNFSERIDVPLEQTTIKASEQEEAIYKRLVGLRNKVLEKEIDSNAIVQWGMYKSFLSSPEACLSTAMKRLDALEKKQEPSVELGELKSLVDEMQGLTIAQSSRFQLLIQQLETMKWNGKGSSPRVLIFTESRLTQSALSNALAKHFNIIFSEKSEDQAKQALCMTHGGMGDTQLAETVEAFGTGSSKIRMMVATDVASEGVNLHHQCHNIIHYDLPWSIITLIQRNGRIDRFGQEQNPIMRYLMVDSKQGLLKGDAELFERLVSKVKEINRSTRSGESVMKIYDAKKEEQRIADAIIHQEKDVLDKTSSDTAESQGLEDLLTSANTEGHDDFMSFLMGDTENIQEEVVDDSLKVDNSRARLMGDVEYLKRGYRTLSEAIEESTGKSDYLPLQDTGEQIIINPPEDLMRRLGSPKASSDVIFGATSIPEEAWPDDGQLYLTAKVERVNSAIKAALAQQGQWSKELLITELHPVMQWLNERLMMLMERGDAPMIASPHLEAGKLLFCFIGQVSSRAGTPLIVDTHAVIFSKGGSVETKPLKEALTEVGFENLANSGKKGTIPDALMQGFVSSAVDQSILHLKKLKDKRRAHNLPRLEEEEKRLKGWFQRWGTGIEEQLVGLPPEGKRANKLRQQREEMEKYLHDRDENWKNAHFRAVDEPNTRLVLVVEGVK
jgi:ERCC4-related helicase